MNYSGFYIIFSLFLILKLSNYTKVNLGLPIGMMIPDIGILLQYFNVYNEFHGSIFHSILFIIFLFCIFLAINELINLNLNNKIINGILFGMILHLLFDIFLCDTSIIFYWPLPLAPINSFNNAMISNKILYLLMVLQLLMFRLYGYKIVNLLINGKKLNSQSYSNINVITWWMRYQSLLIFVFILKFLLKFKFSFDAMNFSILSSIVVALYFSWNIRGQIYKDAIIGK